jgi:hypothetical protein
MSSTATLYRLSHPEYYAQERIRERERLKIVYQNNPEYKEKVKKAALARYYRLKEAKAKNEN